MLSLEAFKNSFSESPFRLPAHMGHCINGDLFNTLATLRRATFQTFLSKQYSKLEERELKSLLSTNQLTGFVHLPYYINLCNPVTKYCQDPIKCLNIVVKQLTTAKYIGFQGCVIHVGKNVKQLEISMARQDMKYYLLWCICHADPACPLLLETCCGAGRELLAKVEDFAAFYLEVVSEFPEYYLKAAGKPYTAECPFGLCVDYAHTFAAGYLPMEFMEKLTNLVGKQAIKLVHFNDSKRLLASRVDGHALPGQGNIPLEQLHCAYYYCLENRISMLIE